MADQETSQSELALSWLPADDEQRSIQYRQQLLSDRPPLPIIQMTWFTGPRLPFANSA